MDKVNEALALLRDAIKINKLLGAGREYLAGLQDAEAFLLAVSHDSRDDTHDIM